MFAQYNVHVSEDTIVRALMLGSTVAWACAECLALRRPAEERARSFYTAAVALAVAHVLAAFYLTYSWSHGAALAATAQQTGALTGLAWGGGLFVNYIFLSLWLADAAWWWIDSSSRARRPIALERSRLTLFAFMFVNGAIVFASITGRIIGIPAVAAVLVTWLRVPRREVIRA